MRRHCLLAVLILWSASTPVLAAPALDALLAGLKREPPVSEPFQDVRFRAALKAPLVSSGTLTWHGGLEFERSVTSPYVETGRVHGRTLTIIRPRGRERVIPLARAPELQVLFGGLSAVFAGDAAAIQTLFTVELEGDSAWRMRLVPKDAALRERVDALELRGEGEHARCLILRQPGAEALTLLGATQPPGPAPDLATLVERNCPSP
jgi:hypothetical protein